MWPLVILDHLVYELNGILAVEIECLMKETVAYIFHIQFIRVVVL